MDNTLIIVFFPFAAAAIIPWFAERFRKNAAWFAVAAPLVSLWALVDLYGEWAAGGQKTITHAIAWVPAANVEISFMVDGLSLMWGFLVAGMGALIVLYSHWYLHEHEALGRYYGFLIAFMGSMLGVVFSDHLISLFIFWELTSITSFFLIGFWSDRKASNYGATKAILITGSGGLAMLGGFLLLGDMAGEWRLSQLVLTPGLAKEISLGVFLLIILGAATKSAQWPFHIWLPNAMEAPTPISAFLHSATMVKAGIYLLSRFYPILGAHPAWGYVVTGFGMTTMIAGGLLSLRAYDLKAILAYGTISQLGLIVTFLGFGGKGAVIGATLHLYNHAAAKAAMFMTVGIIDHEAGTRDVRLLGNLRKLMPKTHILAVIAAFSLIGLPPMGGFITKEMLYEASLHPGGPGSWGWFWPYITVFAGVFTALYHLRFLSEPYWQAAEGEAPKHPHDPPLGMLAAPAILVLMALAFGLAPGLIEHSLVAPAAEATLGGGAHLKLHLGLWHGVNLALIMSLITMALGLALYFGFSHVKAVLDAAARIWGNAPAPNKLYDASMDWLRNGTWEILLLIQDGNLRRYMRLMLVLPTAAALYLVWRMDWGANVFPENFAGASFLLVVIAMMIMAAALATALFKRRISAILALGTMGYGISGLYLLLKAPDLALTQIMIESASVVLFLLVFYYLPELKPIPRSAAKKIRDWGIAVGLGVCATLAMAAAMNTHKFRTIADYFMRTSKPVAGFKNVVNAIIVDYRGYDTLGEITVLVIAGIAIYAIVRLAGGMKWDH